MLVLLSRLVLSNFFFSFFFSFFFFLLLSLFLFHVGRSNSTDEIARIERRDGSSRSSGRQSRRRLLPGEGTPVGLHNFFSSAFYGYARALIMHMLNIKRSPRVLFV